MNKGVFFQRIKYHYKRVLSILFASLGLAFVVGSLTYFVMSSGGSEHSFTSLWNYLILLTAFILILVGAIRGTAIAYSGVLTFVFYILWDFGSYILTYFLTGSFVLLFSGEWYTILYNVVYIVGSIAAFVIGVLLYIRLRQFLTGRYASYVGLRNYALIFMILAIISNGFLPALILLAYPSVDTFISILLPLAVICEALASFFVITRLKSEY